MMKEFLFAYVSCRGVMTGRSKAVLGVQRIAICDSKGKRDAEVQGCFCKRGRFLGSEWAVHEQRSSEDA